MTVAARLKSVAKSAVLPVLAAIAALAAPATAARAETFEFAVWFSDRDFYAEHVRWWASEIEKRTEGRVKFKLHFSGALVAAKETVNAVRTGAAGGGTTSASFVAGLVAAGLLLRGAVLDSRRSQDRARHRAEAAGAVAQADGTARPEADVQLPVGRPRGRTAATATSSRSPTGRARRCARPVDGRASRLQAVGASAVALDPGEVYVALQNKTVDCILFLANLTLSSKVHEVAPYITYWRDGANASMYYLNLAQWNKVSPADQKVMLEVSDQVVVDATPKLAEQQEEALRGAGKGRRQGLSGDARGNLRNEEGHVAGLGGTRKDLRSRGQAVRRRHPAAAEIDRDVIHDGASAAARRDWFDRFEAFTRLVNRVFAAIACLLVLVIMTAIVIQIVYRFLLDDPIAWVLDITIFLLVFVFFLSVAPALQSGSHIEVDMFDSLIPKRHRKPVRLIGKLLTVAFAAIFFWYVAAFYYDIVEVDELSFTMLIVQLKYLYWIGPLGALQFLLTSVVLLIRFWRDPLTDDEPAMADAS